MAESVKPVRQKAEKSDFIPAILSGGSGTRLWPVSRQAFPKQFSELFADHQSQPDSPFASLSLFAKTVSRLMPLGDPWAITVRDLNILTEKVYSDLGYSREQALSQVLYEPRGRNTAPAIALLCKVLDQRGMGEKVSGVFAADHLIENEDAFREAVLRAVEFAKQGEIVTLGVKPTYPATGYGYIETKGGLAGGAKRAIGFREKPNEATAKEFLVKGGFYWNAGMFVFKVSTMIAKLKEFAPKVWQPFEQLKPDLSNLKDIYDQVEAISIDYAVMERLGTHVTVPCDFDWSDVGSWDAVSELEASKRDSGALVQVEADRNFVFRSPSAMSGEAKKTVAFVGVSDLMVIDTQDATLIARRGSSEKVKEVVDRLKADTKHSSKATQHDFEVRPWGRFEILKDTPEFKSKIIVVDPGAQISYQSHAKRAEHWIVVSGRGEVVLNDEVIPVKAGSHVFIPIGAKHRIRNSSNEPIRFVEVQLGTYFGEDDIVRYEDAYGRDAGKSGKST